MFQQNQTTKLLWIQMLKELSIKKTAHQKDVHRDSPKRRKRSYDDKEKQKKKQFRLSQHKKTTKYNQALDVKSEC